MADDLPDDDPLLVEVYETRRINHAIREAMDDVEAGRTYDAEEFMKKVQGQWPPKASA